MFNEDEMSAGKFLRMLRTQKGRAIREVANGTGLSENYISEIERDMKTPSDEVVRSITNYYGIEESILFKKYNRVSLCVTEELLKYQDISDVLYEICRDNSLTHDDKLVIYKKMSEVYNSLKK